MIIAAIMKVTTKVVICLYVTKMMQTATIAEYKVEVALRILNNIIVTRTIGLAIKPSQTKVATKSVEP